MHGVRISPFVVAGRILAVIGMALSVSLGVFLLVGGVWIVGLAVLAAFLPFFALLFLVERLSPRRM